MLSNAVVSSMLPVLVGKVDYRMSVKEHQPTFFYIVTNMQEASFRLVVITISRDEHGRSFSFSPQLRDLLL